MSKHTPGPWETGEASWNEDGEVRYTLHGVRSANAADCRLIAAAPELLAALEYLFSVDMEGCLMMDGEDDQIDAIKLAKAAIARARGEA